MGALKSLSSGSRLTLLDGLACAYLALPLLVFCAWFKWPVAAALIVTHDAEEAMLMGDEIALMKAGQILQTGSPRDCYMRPASIAAARLLGEANVLEGELKNGRVRTAFGEVMAAGRNGPVKLMARPEGVVIGDVGVEAQVADVAFMGAYLLAAVRTADGALVMARTGSAAPPKAGQMVRVALDPAFCAVFAA